MEPAGRHRVRRWPLHPPPGELEALSSWLGRLAAAHGLSVAQLLGNLDLPELAHPGRRLEAGAGGRVARDVDGDPPPGLAEALAERTGIEVGRVHAMTLAGWQGLLLHTPGPKSGSGQGVFQDYVRANSVLLAPGEARAHQVGRTRGAWAGPWIPRQPLDRVCPACAVYPDGDLGRDLGRDLDGRPRSGPALFWRLPLLSSCVEHACLLVDGAQHRWAALTADLRNRTAHQNADNDASERREGRRSSVVSPVGEPVMELVPVPEPLATMDRYTHQGLTTGRVDLPGRSVHAAVWFRLLRSLLDEVSLAPTTCRRQTRLTLERVWADTGRPVRGGVRVWQVFEHLQPDHRDAMLAAAAAALHLAANGTITARGRLADAVQPPPAHDVYAGDPPRSRSRASGATAPSQRLGRRARPAYSPEATRETWDRISAEIDATILAARTDPAIAITVMSWFSMGSQTPEQYHRERSYVIGLGIPEQFLPTTVAAVRQALWQ